MRRLAAAPKLNVLDIWAVSRMTDATIDVVASLPAPEELSVRRKRRHRGRSKKIATLPGLASLTFDNGDAAPGDR